jgi:hypothetical protein
MMVEANLIDLVYFIHFEKAQGLRKAFEGVTSYFQS